MKSKNNITFVIFAYNEEKRIAYSVRNFIKYGEVVIIDNFSTDKTIDIAEWLWAKVYQFKNPGYVETQEELDFVRSKINTEYMTWSFADHIWSKELLVKTTELIREWTYDWIATVQKNYHYGIENLNFSTYHYKWKKHSQHVRVYKKELMYCEWTIHWNLRHKCTNIFYMPLEDIFYIHHLSLYNLVKFEIGHSKYSSIESQMRYDAGEKVSFSLLILKTLWIFIKYYFVDWAWKSWIPWFIMVMQYVFFTFNIGAKQWELENSITLNSIESNYNIIREKYLTKIEK